MERLRENVHSFLKGLLKDRVESLIRVATKRFNESAADHIVDVFTASILLFFMIGCFSFVGVLAARSYVDLTVTFTFALYALLVIWLPITIFELFYVGPKIIRRITNYEPVIQYKVLLFSKKPLLISFLPLPFLAFVILLPRFVSIDSVGELGDAILPRLFVMCSLAGFLLMCLSFPWSVVFTLTKEKNLAINVGLIRHVESIISEEKRGSKLHDPSADIWIQLMRNIFNKCKMTLKNHTGAGNIDLHKPFGVISLAFIMGNSKKRTEVREWVAEFVAILTDKRLTEATKSERILNKLENIDEEKEFSEAKLRYEKLGFDYGFEPFWTKSGWKTVAIPIIIDAILVVVTIIEFMRRGF